MDTGELQPKQESHELSEVLHQEQPGKAINTYAQTHTK